MRPARALLSLCLLAAAGAAQLPLSSSFKLLDYKWDAEGGPAASLSFAAYAAGQSYAGSLSSANFSAQIGFLAVNDPQPTNAPVVFADTPDFGTKDGGTLVAVSGINFDKFGSAPSVSMTVGGNAATGLSVLSNTQLTATTPAGAMGPADILVSSSFGSGTKPGGFVYTPAVVASPSAVIGGSIQVKNYGPLGSLFDLWWSPVTTFIPLPPFGTILIGPSPAFKLLNAAYPAPNGIHTKTSALPNDPSLHGVSIHFQSVSIQLAPLVISLTNRSTTLIQ